MAPTRFFSLLALSTLAVVTSSIAPVTALSHGQHNHIRGHDAIAKRKRSGSVAKRACKPKAPVPSPESAVPVPEPSKSVKVPEPEETPKTPTPPTPPVSNGSAKRGLAWDLGDDPALQYWKSDKTQWFYTWSPYYHKDCKKLGFKPLPMFWGASQRNDFIKMVVNGRDDYAEHILGFNEPDHHEQAQMNPGSAADLWMELINPMKDRNYQLISPAVTSGDYGTVWMSQFMDACKQKGCHFDGMAIHYYGTDPQQMIKYIEERYQKYGLPIWITEFACQNFAPGGKQCSQAEVDNFLTTILKYADEKDYIHAVIPFGVLHNMNNVEYSNQLMAGSGEPNRLGQLFLHG